MTHTKQNLNPPFTFETEDELKTFVATNNIFKLSDFNNSDLADELEANGYYVFKNEREIKDYIKDKMGYDYLFQRKSDVLEYVKDNHLIDFSLSFNNSTEINSIYKEDAIELIEKLSIDKGWQWIIEKLKSC